MSKVCLVATGVPSVFDTDKHHGAGLRATHFVSALLDADCKVLVVAVLPRDDDACGRIPSVFSIGEHHAALIETTERDLADGKLTSELEAFAADAFVGISAMGAALACDIAGDTPLWADVFGDLMAEAQAKAVVHDSDAALPRFWTLLTRALERADRFSAVSKRQADALVGQLGLVGRLSKATAADELVHTIPCAAEAVAAPAGDDVAELRNAMGLGDAFVVLCNGSFNTWCDVDTLYAGLIMVMAECPQVHFVATGGAVAGHDERTYARFRDLIAMSDYRDRFHLEGWVAASRLPLYYALADVAVNVERPCYERRLGSENRVAEWLAAGVPVVTTAQSEQGRVLADAGIAEEVAVADAPALSRTLAALSARPERLRELSSGGRRYAAERLRYGATAAPMVAWARAPVRAGDAASPRLLRVGLVSEPKAMVALLEAYVSELGTAELLRRGLRWMWRRVVGG